jgi:hypothetical protein
MPEDILFLSLSPICLSVVRRLLDEVVRFTEEPRMDADEH